MDSTLSCSLLSFSWLELCGCCTDLLSPSSPMQELSELEEVRHSTEIIWRALPRIRRGRKMTRLAKTRCLNELLWLFSLASLYASASWRVSYMSPSHKHPRHESHSPVVCKGFKRRRQSLMAHRRMWLSAQKVDRFFFPSQRDTNWWDKCCRIESKRGNWPNRLQILYASKTHWMVLYASSDRYSCSISQHCMEVKYVMRMILTSSTQ